MITRLANIGVHVADIDRSLAFYRDLLGLVVRVDTGWKRDPDLLAVSATPGGAIRIVNLAPPGVEAPPEASMTLVQLDGLDERAIRGRFQDPGTVHLAFMSDDLDADLARLTAAGVATLAPPALLSGAAPGTSKLVFVTDPDGFFVELVQRLA